MFDCGANLHLVCCVQIGLTGFKCRCGFVFCGPHRLAEAHACDYDYKSNGALVFIAQVSFIIPGCMLTIMLCCISVRLH